MLESSKGRSALKVGFLVNPDFIEQHHLDLMDSIAEEDIFDNPIIIEHIQGSHSTKIKISIKNKIQAIVISFIQKIEVWKVRINPLSKDYLSKYNVARILSMRQSFVKCNAELLSADQLDVLIDFSYSNIGNSIFKKSKLGIIKPFGSMFSSDQNSFLGFLEVLKKNSQSSINILYMKNQNENFLIFNGKIMTRSLWHQNRAALLNKSNALILTCLKNFHDNENFYNQIDASRDNVTTQEKVNLTQSLEYLFLVFAKAFFSTSLNKMQISKKYNRWSVAYFKGSDFTKDLGRANEIKNLPGRFFADPFVIKYEDRTICFVEDFFFSESKGKISAIEIFETGYKFLDIVLEEDFHLSFPYIFIENGNVFMIPETSETNEIRLYQATNFPIEWKLRKVLMKEVSAVDTIVFKKEKLWFMLTNICSSGADDHSSELHIFYSESLDSMDWRPIKKSNPVIFDSFKARNGGFFELNNKKYRVNQVQDFSHYGKCFAINIIIDISPDNYKEETVLEINPNYLEDIISTHHYHSNGDYTVFDYCKNETIL